MKKLGLILVALCLIITAVMVEAWGRNEWESMSRQTPVFIADFDGLLFWEDGMGGYYLTEESPID